MDTVPTMTEAFDFWRALAGLGLFLLAMDQLESALQALGGRNLADFLRRRTDRPLKAVGAGIVATALLQSSSVVGLMVLAFVGAGLLALPNALGVIFGANLGTTATGWIVAALGLKLDINNLALPLLGVGALAAVAGRDRLASLGRVAVGLGLLLLGLEFMKESVAGLQARLDVNTLAGLAPWQYLAFGTAFAAVIRSSSATMMVTLAALDGGLVTLPSAAAIAIGADLGTTFTVLLGAAKGTPSKRRVALAHFLFNLVTDALAFALRVPLLALVAMLGFSDPLYSLVAFHSLFNLLGLVLFVPAIGPFARFLEGRFVAAVPAGPARYVREASAAVPDAALQAIDRETAHLIGRVIRQNMLALTPPLPLPPGRLPVADVVAEDADNWQFASAYARTKELEGEILGFAIQLQAQPLEPAQSARLNQLLSAVREAVRSSKLLKDIRHNLDEFRDSPRRQVKDYLDHYRSVMGSFVGELFALRRPQQAGVSFEDLVALIQQAHAWHDQVHGEIYADVSAGSVGSAEISSLLNVNRELLNSNLALLDALKDYHLNAEQAQAVTRLPGAG